MRALLASPKAQGFFQAAIAQSNGGGAGKKHTLCSHSFYSAHLSSGAGKTTTSSNYLSKSEEVAKFADSIISATNCTDSDPAAVRSCLKSVPATTLVALPKSARDIVVDGTYITSSQLPLDGNSAGVSYVPTIFGYVCMDCGYTTPAHGSLP